MVEDCSNGAVLDRDSAMVLELAVSKIGMVTNILGVYIY